MAKAVGWPGPDTNLLLAALGLSSPDEQKKASLWGRLSFLCRPYAMGLGVSYALPSAYALA